MAGYFGTPCARRHARTPDPELHLPPPETAECANCESIVVLAGRKLPKGWVVLDGQALCADCAPPPEGALREARAPQLQAGHKVKSIGPAAPARYRGCRIGHEVALGHAALQIRAGATPPPGRDEAVQFLLDARGLDELIIELSVIRAELTASQSPGTAAREGESNNG
ncbi:MAG: hypothetical protein ACM3ZV_07525 [Bacillota bacterium]